MKKTEVFPSFSFLCWLVAGCLCASCSLRQSPPPSDDDSEQFTTEVLLRTTPVKNQGSGNLCWIYAMLATIETEHIMEGDSIDLSPAFATRALLTEETRKRYVDAHYTIRERGMATMTLRLLELYGAMPFTSYRMAEDYQFQRVSKLLTRLADQCRSHLKGISSLDASVRDVLDDNIGSQPNWVFMFGCQYTPKEFARSVCSKGEYAALTSFSHHPFGEPFVLEVPDNRYHDAFLNVPIDSLMKYVEYSLRSGHPVCWEGDITEPCYDASKGTARLEDGHRQVTQQTRQEDFDHHITTDDHCMEMIGIAHDKQGRKYFICKNSHGKNNPYHGWMYLEEDYVKAKTIAVILPAITLPPMQVLAPPPADAFDQLFSLSDAD